MKKNKRKKVTSIKKHERQLMVMKRKRDVKAYFMMDDPNPCDDWKPAKWYYDEYCLCGLSDCTPSQFYRLASAYCDKKKMLGHTGKSGTSHYKLNRHTLNILSKKGHVIFGEDYKEAA